MGLFDKYEEWKIKYLYNGNGLGAKPELLLYYSDGIYVNPALCNINSSVGMVALYLKMMF